MPTPKQGENESDWMKRCVPVVLKEGTAKSQEQAVAICLNMLREHKKGSNE